MVASRPGIEVASAAAHPPAGPGEIRTVGPEPDPPAGPDDEAVRTLAARVARARRAAGLTLAAVADRAGVSAAYVSQIESAAANPTVRSLARVAEALGTTPGELLGPPSGEPPRGRRFEPRFAPTPRAATTAGVQAIWDLTAMDSTRIGVRLVRGDAGDHASSVGHPGEEFLMVLAGRCHLHVGGRTRELGPFDACHYAACDPHHIDGASEDLLLLVVLTDD
ncbi:helix-turn-helix domain-containing protein [Krasilnikovia sp. MM14-A1259]|uniref:helix-turn-helix domain-containing protein n=1 Tax=Krasilnikovia sp. MM14-A1259 TaxID=3373539 RepID=UPI003814F934